MDVQKDAIGLARSASRTGFQTERRGSSLRVPGEDISVRLYWRYICRQRSRCLLQNQQQQQLCKGGRSTWERRLFQRKTTPCELSSEADKGNNAPVSDGFKTSAGMNLKRPISDVGRKRHWVGLIIFRVLLLIRGCFINGSNQWQTSLKNFFCLCPFLFSPTAR